MLNREKEKGERKMQKTAVLIDKPKNNKIVRGVNIPEHLQHLSREDLRNLLYLFRGRC